MSNRPTRGPLLVFSTGIFCVAILFGLRRHSQPQYPEVPAQRKRIDDFIAEIKKETLQQSCENLINSSRQYFVPGVTGSLEDQLDLERMLSNRRSVKVLQEIKKLKRNDQEARCKDLFNLTYRSHTNRWYYVFARRRDPSLAPLDSRSTGARQLGLCAAMFAAADLGFRELLQDEFAQIISFDNDMQRLEIENPSPGPGKWDFIPDRRFQVNLLRLLAYQERKRRPDVLAAVDQECQRARMRTNQIAIVPWDARTTAFEHLVLSPIDTSKGVTTYFIYSWRYTAPTEEFARQERDQVNKLRTLVLE